MVGVHMPVALFGGLVPAVSFSAHYFMARFKFNKG